MRVRDYLSVPYLLEAQAVEHDGTWTRRLSYPELGNVTAENEDVEQAYLDLERQRIVEVMRRLQAGDPPPMPRAPLTTTDQGWWARQLGLGALIDGKLDRLAADLTENT